MTAKHFPKQNKGIMICMCQINAVVSVKSLSGLIFKWANTFSRQKDNNRKHQEASTGKSAVEQPQIQDIQPPG